MQYSTARGEGGRSFSNLSVTSVGRGRSPFFWPQGGAPRPKRTTFHNPVSPTQPRRGESLCYSVFHWERVCLDNFLFCFVLSDGWTALHPSQSAEHAVSQHAPRSCKQSAAFSSHRGHMWIMSQRVFEKNKREHTHGYNLYFLMSHCGHTWVLFLPLTPRFTLRGAVNN